MFQSLYSLVVSAFFWVLLVPFAIALLLGLITSAVTKAPSASTASDIDGQVEAVKAALTQFISSAQERLEQGKKANQETDAQLKNAEAQVRKQCDAMEKLSEDIKKKLEELKQPQELKQS